MRAILLISSVILLSACVNVRGTEAVLDSTLAQEAEQLRSMPLSVHRKYGQPHTVSLSEDGSRTWTYYQVTDRLKYASFLPYIGFFVGGWDVDWTEQTFVFSGDDELLSTTNNTDMKYKNNLAFTGDVFTRNRQVRAVREEMERLGLPFDNDGARQMAAVVDRYVD